MGRDRDQPREFRPTKRKAKPNEDKAKRLTENKSLGEAAHGQPWNK